MAARVKANPKHVRALFGAIEDAGLDYAVIHGVDRIPDDVDSDMDVVVSSASMDALTRLLADFSLARSGVLCQVIRHESTARYHVLALVGEDGDPAFLKLDASSDFRRDGCVLFTGEELLAGARKREAVSAVAVGVEFAAYLAKRVLKRDIDAEHVAELRRLWEQDEAQCRDELGKLVGSRHLSTVADVMAGLQAEVACERLRALRPAILRGALRRHPWRSLGYNLGRPLRVLDRVARRTGYQVAVLGPDGVGKSSVLAGLGEQIRPAFRRVETVHLRPGVLPARGSGDNVQHVPYAAQPYGPVRSALKLAYLVADYVVGYVFASWPRLVASTLILCDRYFLDVAADPARYRYGGPDWLVRAAARLVPGPDVYVLLEASVGEVQSRKAEVSPAATSAQLAGYRALRDRYGRIEVADATGTPECVLRNAAWLVLRMMASREVTRP